MIGVGVDIIKDTADALQEVSDSDISVAQGWYDGDIKKKHVTLWDLGESEQDHSDDNAECEKHTVQVTIFSKEDETTLARTIKDLMKAADFIFEGRNPDDSQPEDGIYMKAQRFSKLYEREE